MQAQDNMTVYYRRGKPKNSAWKPLRSSPSRIHPLVNKLEYKDYNIDPLSLDYPLYLDSLSPSYQQASPNLVFTSFLDPAISSNCIHQRMASSNASYEHQNNSQHLQWMRLCLGLKPLKGYVIKEVGVEEK